MENSDLFPPTLEINGLVNKVRLFVGDHWVEVGKIEVVSEGPRCTHLRLPDIDAFLDDLEMREDGSEDWYMWGCRVN